MLLLCYTFELCTSFHPPSPSLYPNPLSLSTLSTLPYSLPPTHTHARTHTQFYLSCILDKVNPRVHSAAIPYVRPLSSGVESYQTDPTQYPVTQPLTKLSALQQASGEAKYTTDMPTLPEEIHAAFVLSTVGNAKILSVDPTPALVGCGWVVVQRNPQTAYAFCVCVCVHACVDAQNPLSQVTLRTKLFMFISEK